MQSSDSFSDNPFTHLDLSLFPKDRHSHASHIPELSDSDRQLFLSTWDKLPEKLDKLRGGFRISEQVDLPHKIRRKKTRIVLPPVEERAVQDTEDEEFLAAMRSATPLGGKGRKVALKPKPATPMRDHGDDLEEYLAKKLEFAVSSRDEYLDGHVVGLDELIINRLKEGQFSPEAHIDLHGLNVDQAFEAIKEFIRQAWYKDLRTVLLVPGRGLNSPNGQGILRQKIQIWLTKEPFKRLILAFCTAKPHDGGPGSIYVLLRRYRKKGPVQWERMFVEGEWD